ECSVAVTAPSTTPHSEGTLRRKSRRLLTHTAQGTFTVHWTFNDGNGNSSTANQTVIVHDVTAPVAPTIADATGECSVTVTAPTKIGSAAGRERGTTSDAPTYLAQGTTTVHWP